MVFLRYFFFKFINDYSNVFKFVILLCGGLRTLSAGQQTLDAGQQTQANPGAWVCSSQGVCVQTLGPGQQTQTCWFAINGRFCKPRREGLLPICVGLQPWGVCRPQAKVSRPRQTQARWFAINVWFCRPRRAGLLPICVDLQTQVSGYTQLGVRIWSYHLGHDSPSARCLVAMLCPSAWGPQLDHGPTKFKLIIFFPTILLMPNQKDNPIPPHCMFCKFMWQRQLCHYTASIHYELCLGTQ